MQPGSVGRTVARHLASRLTREATGIRFVGQDCVIAMPWRPLRSKFFFYEVDYAGAVSIFWLNLAFWGLPVIATGNPNYKIEVNRI